MQIETIIALAFSAALGFGSAMVLNRVGAFGQPLSKKSQEDQDRLTSLYTEPRKFVVNNSSQMETPAEDQPVKRKPGRPRKVQP